MSDYSVAIVDDDEHQRKLMRTSYVGYEDCNMLDSTDFDICTDLSDDVDEAFEFLESEYDAVILDNKLAWDWEGIEIYTRAMERDTDLGVVLHTGDLGYKSKFSEEKAENGENHNGLRYVRKHERKDGASSFKRTAEAIDSVIRNLDHQT